MNEEKKKFTVRLVDAIKKWYEPIVAKANNLIGKELAKLSPEDRKDENKTKEVARYLAKRNQFVGTWYSLEEARQILEFDKPRPNHFASKSGEIVSNLGYKIGNKEVEVHHGHVTVMNKLNTLYWIHSPKDNKIIILALLEEHPKSNRGYSKKELLKRLPKDIPDDLLNLENKTTKEDYPEILKIKEKKLIRISTGKYKVGAIYRESRTDKYFLLSNYVKSTYVIIKLDDLTRDKEVLSTSSILDLLDYHQNDLFLYNRESDSLTRLDCYSAKKLLNRSLYISYKSDESIKELLLVIEESISSTEIYNKDFYF